MKTSPYRICPRCEISLEVATYRDVQLDHCRRCGGTFLESGEEAAVLGEMFTPAKWMGFAVDSTLPEAGGACPADRQRMIVRSLELDDAAVQVDFCPACNGLWLDKGECVSLRRILGKASQDPISGIPEAAGIGSYFFQILTHLPLEVWNPRHRTPWITFGLLIAMALIFVMEILSPGVAPNSNGVVWWHALMLVPSEVSRGNGIWTLFTYALLHASPAHLFGNAYFLYMWGDNVEDRIGKLRYLLLFWGAAAAGGLLEVVCSPDSGTSIAGASGAVAGLAGAYLALFPKAKLYHVLMFIRFRLNIFWYLGLWISFNFLMWCLGVPGVAWGAHIGGFLTGMILGILWEPSPLFKRFQTRA